MGNECTVWFNTVLRGDVNSIRIGNKVNIQDGSILHTLYEKSQIHIGDNVSVGHNVTIHGATIKDNVLLVWVLQYLDHAVVESNTIIAANALVFQEPNANQIAFMLVSLLKK
jgi:carbonic anhydrase/acetyltransferase-like protein (isoleucine patch superfamily)